MRLWRIARSISKMQALGSHSLDVVHSGSVLRGGAPICLARRHDVPAGLLHPHGKTASHHFPPAAAFEKARLVILPLPLFVVPALCDVIALHLAHGS